MELGWGYALGWGYPEAEAVLIENLGCQWQHGTSTGLNWAAQM